MEGSLLGILSSRAKAAFATFSTSSKAVAFIFIILFLGAFVSSRRIDSSSYLRRIGNSGLKFPWTSPKPSPKPKPKVPPATLTCPARDPANTCPPSHTSPSPSLPPSLPPAPPGPACPNYFRWIHEDLRPWAAAGIARETQEHAAADADFRLVILGGRAFIHHYHGVFQTRDVFTIWGVLQLLRRYPGRVPDLDLMFNCGDMPIVRRDTGGGPRPPPPLFRYCKDDSTVDIVFPDWSFWGWPEVNIRPWETLGEELREANEMLTWRERKPFAYWKGNPDVAGTRGDLMKCNVSKEEDWEARLFRVNWQKEGRQRFKESNLAKQCTHRYKVYIEGRAWSVSEKYILGCDSPTLYVESKFEDFVSRGLRPGHHYWPIPQKGKCRAIKQAVEWGNTHPREVQTIGKEGSGFIHKQLKMDYVYDYMLHLLTEYSKLLTYKPTKPEDAVEVCLESMACTAQGKVRDFLLESMAWGPTDAEPCAMPPAFEPKELRQLRAEKSANGTRRVVASMIRRSSGERLIGLHWTFMVTILSVFSIILGVT